MTPVVRPPRWAEALLRIVLPPGTVGASVKADLDQEFNDALARESAMRARAWYAWEATKIAAHFIWGVVRPGAEGRRGGVGDRMAQNVRIALRRAGRAPGFTVVAVVTIALGIGANVAIFSVVNTVLLEPLPYTDADRLVAIWEWNLARDRRDNVANPGNFSAWRDGSEAFREMTAVSLSQPATITVAGRPDEAMMQYASPDFFSVLGLEARLGRVFITQLNRLETTEAIVSHGYWQRRFGGSPDVIGQTIQVNSVPAVVVGVLPPEYVVFGEGTDLWVSIQIDLGDQTNSGRWLMVLGRLEDDATLEVADEEMKALSAALAEDYPDFNAGWSVSLVPLKRQVVGEVRQALWILLGAVGLLLLIACANVANLFLVRATHRQREMAVRTSLGASGRVLAAQLLTESVLIAGLGATLGVGVAHVGTRWVATTMPDAFALPRVQAAGVDGTVLLFAAVVTVGTALLFGLLPALQAARTSPAGTLNAESRGPSRRSGVVRSALVVGEVAVSVVLLSGAALLSRSFVALMAVDAGIAPEHVMVGRVNLSGDSYPDAAAKVVFFDELLGRLSARPGIEAAGGITFLPMDGPGAGTSYWPADRPVPAPEDRVGADIRNVSGDYFEAMGIELLRGRLFDSRDRAAGPQAVVVNRRLADTYWPGGSAVGEHVVVDWVDQEPWEIIGIVEDVRLAGPEAVPGETIYIDYAQGTFFPWLHVVVRATGDPASITSTVRSELASMDETLPLGSVRLMDDIVARSVARPRITSVLMLLFAGLATILAAVGLYGVLAYAVSQRIREIGVRIALGARPGDVLVMVVGQGLRLAVGGLAIGLMATIGGNRVLESLLYEIPRSDPVSLGGASLVLVAVSVLACTVPAWRASRVAPAEALRSE